MFLGELIQVIVVDTNHDARAKIAARESACPDKLHRQWVNVTLEEMMAFLGLVINMNLIHKDDAREYWSSNLSQVTPFLRVVFHKDRFLEMYNFHYHEFCAQAKKDIILFNILANNTKGCMSLKARVRERASESESE